MARESDRQKVAKLTTALEKARARIAKQDAEIKRLRRNLTQIQADVAEALQKIGASFV
jgi:F0F1-type ATP synthase membrane subunit b/b'